MTDAVLMSWFVVTGIFFVIVLALAVAIQWLGDDARQDWLERSLWGKIGDPRQKYRDIHEEMEQYAIVIGAA